MCISPDLHQRAYFLNQNYNAIILLAIGREDPKWTQLYKVDPQKYIISLCCSAQIGGSDKKMCPSTQTITLVIIIAI